MAEVEIGIGKSARRAYGFDDLTIVPSRRTRDPEAVDTAWELDSLRFELPLMAAAMDSVVSPATAVELSRLGVLPVLNLEGVWTRYEDPEPLLEEVASLDGDKAIARLQEIYAEPVKGELIVARVAEIKAAGGVACGALSPQRTTAHVADVLRAELDMFVIQGTVVSAEHVAVEGGAEPLNLKTFIRQLDVPVVVGGCASYQAALHLMRTGAVAVLVGVGQATVCEAGNVLGVGVPQATAVSDAAGARMRHLDETGVYVQVIANGGIRTGGDIAKAVACGADAVMVGAPLAAAAEAPGRGAHWGLLAGHPTLPRGGRVTIGRRGSLAEILTGPAHDATGTTNLAGALRSTMALTGHQTVKELQKAELVVSSTAVAL